MTEAWNPADRLPLRGTFTVLEASAGTGKTYQIGGIATRLVAQENVPIERILLITFTTAATAELRDRVRRRLAIARTALLSSAAPADDEVVLALVRESEGQPDLRALYLKRLGKALLDYDRAPVSTIHGFCQRTLDGLAFESGQEAGLTLLANPAALHEQLVTDALASVYATADATEVAVLEEQGFKVDSLRTIARVMTGPVEPDVEPAAAAAGGIAGFRVASWATVQAACAQARLKTVKGDYEKAEASKPKPFSGLGPTKLAEILCWIDELASAVPVGRSAVLGLARRPSLLTTQTLRKNWCSPSPVEAFSGYILAEALQQLDASALLSFFAGAVRPSFEAELARRGALTYDAMLSRLEAVVRREATEDHKPLTTALSAQYDAVLVDEFQDTDAAQWGVIQRAFSRGGHWLFVIGDPKQAIYRFRGADLHVYLDAKKDAAAVFRLGTNHRTDEPLVSAVNALWAPSAMTVKPFGDAKISYEPVGARHSVSRLTGSTPPALALRWFDAQTYNPDCALGKPVGKTAARALTAKLCAAECQRLLRTKLFLPNAKPGADPRPVTAGDLAVLVYWHSEARLVQAALAERGIPSVAGGRTSIFSSAAVGWLRAWLDAVASPEWERAVRLLAVSPLIGWTASDLAGALAEASPGVGSGGSPSRSPRDWEALRLQVSGWSRDWNTRGFAKVFHHATRQHRIYPRLLGHTPGERGATDLRQLAELCDAEQRRSRLGPGALSEWLHRQELSGTDDAAEDAVDEKALRLESDAQAVRIVTIHGCKGLQYPITLLPFCWDDHEGKGDGDGPLMGRSDLEKPTLYVAGKSAAAAAAKVRLEQEKKDEAWRQLYVAMTRAEHHCVAWLGAVTCESPLGQLVGQMARAPAKLTADWGKSVDHAAVRQANRAKADALVSGAGLRSKRPEFHGISFVHQTTVPPMSRGYLAGPTTAPPPPAVQLWETDRTLGARWQVASYSSLSAPLHVESMRPLPVDLPPTEADAPGEGDDAGDLLSEDLEDPADSQTPPPPTLPAGPALNEEVGRGLPQGKEGGNWMHALLEGLDFQTLAGLSGETLEELVSKTGREKGGSPAHDAAVQKAVAAWVQTPLDGPAGTLTASAYLPSGFTLQSIAAAERWNELPFDLSLGAGANWVTPTRNMEGDYTGRIDPRAVRHALGLASGHGGYGSWVGQVLARPNPESEKAIKNGRNPEDPDVQFARVLPSVAGLLTGSIDLVFRVGGAGGRYFLADYKSNRIVGTDEKGVPHRESVQRDYTRPMLQWEMDRRAYHLQALLYTVALHRLLQLRLGSKYRYDTHVGGHLYLFLKGMLGANTPRYDGTALGVYSDRWPESTVVALDAALKGEGGR